MKQYRVFGRRYQDYKILVTAADPKRAAEAANNSPLSAWDEIPTDDVVEATDVYSDEGIKDWSDEYNI